jgi:hypothetical protein
MLSPAPSLQELYQVGSHDVISPHCMQSRLAVVAGTLELERGQAPSNQTDAEVQGPRR